MNAEPILVHATEISDAWTDYNGHMNVAYYVLVFDHGTDGFLELIGLDTGFRERTGSSVFVAEAHGTYDQEVMAGESVYVTSQVLGFDAKRLHLFHRMHRHVDGVQLASNEVMILHVDLKTRRVAPFPDNLARRIADIAASQRRLPPPAEAGRRIAIPVRDA
ncbi:MAG: thioesterase family protein [Proteobacteria bacterium]|nr:thioesterase family protein [Pseudomonadota bacterium]